MTKTDIDNFFYSPDTFDYDADGRMILIPRRPKVIYHAEAGRVYKMNYPYHKGFMSG